MDEYGFEIIFLCIMLLILLPFLSKQQKISLDFEEFEQYLINSGECVSTFKNSTLFGSSKYKGVFLYSGEYFEIDLSLNDYINLGGVLIDNCR